MARPAEIMHERGLLGPQRESAPLGAQKARERSGTFDGFLESLDVVGSYEQVTREHGLREQTPNALVLLEDAVAQREAVAHQLRTGKRLDALGHGALPARHHLQHIASPTARRHGRLDRFSWRDPDDAGFSNDASDGRGASDAAYSMRLATVFLRLPPPRTVFGSACHRRLQKQGEPGRTAPSTSLHAHR